MMKALSLWEPWASLIAHGYKTIETRSWERPHRGLLAIHAAKTPKAAGEVVRLFREAGLTRDRDRSGPPDHLDRFSQAVGDWPFGKIVALATVEDIVPTDGAHPRIVGMSFAESRFGNYSAGRFAWLLRDVVRLEPAIPCKGLQGLFFVPKEIELEVLRAAQKPAVIA